MPIMMPIMLCPTGTELTEITHGCLGAGGVGLASDFLKFIFFIEKQITLDRKKKENIHHAFFLDTEVILK